MAEHWMERLQKIVGTGNYAVAQSRHTRTPIVINRKLTSIASPGRMPTLGAYIPQFSPASIEDLDVPTAMYGHEVASMFADRNRIPHGMVIAGALAESPEYDHLKQTTYDPKRGFDVPSPQTTIRHEDVHSALGSLAMLPAQSDDVMGTLADEDPNINELANNLSQVGYGNDQMLNEVTARLVSQPQGHEKSVGRTLRGLGGMDMLNRMDSGAMSKLRKILHSGYAQQR